MWDYMLILFFNQNCDWLNTAIDYTCCHIWKSIIYIVYTVNTNILGFTPWKECFEALKYFFLLHMNFKSIFILLLKIHKDLNEKFCWWMSPDSAILYILYLMLFFLLFVLFLVTSGFMGFLCCCVSF